MLRELKRAIATKVTFSVYGPNISGHEYARIQSADELGIVLGSTGPFGGRDFPIFIPWTAISVVTVRTNDGDYRMEKASDV